MCDREQLRAFLQKKKKKIDHVWFTFRRKEFIGAVSILMNDSEEKSLREVFKGNSKIYSQSGHEVTD